MAYPKTKSNSYGRFGFSISQGDGGKGPFMLHLVGEVIGAGEPHRSIPGEVRLALSETQGLMLLSDLAEFGAQVFQGQVWQSIKANSPQAQ